MKKYLISMAVFCLLVTATVVTLFAGAATASSDNVVQSAAGGNRPNIKISNSASSNWSGYAVESSLASPQPNSVTDVKGQWVVPAVTNTGQNTYSSSWVGIDGYSDGTVEQIGTEQDWTNGTTRYYAWFEMYPKFPVTIKMTVSPGDKMSAEVSYTGSNRFSLTISDLTTGKSYTTTQKARAQRSSAEWIEEAPSSIQGILPLSDFGTVTFTAASATINGHTGTINDLAWQNDPMTMISSGGAIKAQPGPLSSDGSSFSINWLSS